MSTERPALRALSDRLGIDAGYRSALDRRFVATPDSTREALARAMGFDAATEAAAAVALDALGPTPEAVASTPRRCIDVDGRLGGRRGFGIVANLYSTRSGRDWGFGALRELEILVDGAARAGADFVGLNPLHVVGNRDGDVCPYAPVSRLYRNPLYIDAEQVPERAAAARDPILRAAQPIEALRRRREIDAREAERVLFDALRPMHACFVDDRASDVRRRSFADYLRSEGPLLESFATFQAIADVQEKQNGSRDWRRWPSELGRPDAPAVRAFRAEHRAEIDFHAWLQFELDAQLGRAGEAAHDAGMAIGLYTDLALGSGAGGFDTWACPELFAHGVSAGAPPDAFSRSGQDWGFPPLDPHALARTDFHFWRRVLEANVRGAGALRVDHVLGLRRLFWIPDGAAPADGAYVRYPETALLDVLCDVSRARDVVVIGEDLGTVPDGFSAAIRERGLLSSRVLLFERDEDGFRPSSAWPADCLATANTHDLPPLAGWLAEDDVALRHAIGQIPDTETRDEIVAERRRDRRALHVRLVDDGLLGAGDQSPERWLLATTQFLGNTPAALVGISLDDLGGERIPINVPGVAPDRHRSWVRRMQADLDAIFARPGAVEALAAMRSRSSVR